MRVDNNQNKWYRARGKKRAHWGILTLDDLSKTNGKYNQLIAELQAGYRVAKELGEDKPRQKSEDFSI